MTRGLAELVMFSISTLRTIARWSPLGTLGVVFETQCKVEFLLTAC